MSRLGTLGLAPLGDDAPDHDAVLSPPTAGPQVLRIEAREDLTIARQTEALFGTQEPRSRRSASPRRGSRPASHSVGATSQRIGPSSPVASSSDRSRSSSVGAYLCAQRQGGLA